MTERSRLMDQAAPILLGIISSGTILILVCIFAFLLYTGIHVFETLTLRDFLTPIWNPTAYNDVTWGILSMLLGTLYVSVLALFFAIPSGLAIAVYISEIASSRVRAVLKPLIEMIGSIPSVVLGFLGLIYLAPFIARLFHQPNGLNALTASVLVALTALPTIASLSEDALFSVKKIYREASLALGATKWETIVRVVIPAARSGILASIMLGLGRVVGETMIVLMVAGNSRAVPHNIFSPVNPVTARVAIDVKEVVIGGLHWQSLFLLGFILFVLTFVINFIADVLIQRTKI